MAFPEIGNSIGDTTPNDVYIPELLELLREGRPTADLFNARALPSTGNTVQLPDVTTGNTVGYQDGEATPVSNTVQAWILNDFKKATMAGGQGITLQAAQWSDPAYTSEVITDLVSAYAEFLDSQTINGDPAVDTPVSGTGYNGILNAGATDVPVGGDVKAAIALMGTAWAAVYAGSKRSPVAAIMNSEVWGSFLNQVDSDGRPLVSTDAPSNPVGIGNPGSVAGTLRSIPVVLDDSAPATLVILGSFRDALLYENTAQPATISLTYPSSLVTDVSVYGFSSLAIRRPGAFAILSGITI
jgi:HK97 family phage major capsid protein